MNPDDDVCLCFHVSLRKIRAYLNAENPRVASLIGEVLSAGTGCQWCVPFLRELHRQHQRGEKPDLPFGPEEYAEKRGEYKAKGERDAAFVRRAAGDEEEPDRPGS